MAEAFDEYKLVRSKEESARLERQHSLWTTHLGYILSPLVRPLSNPSSPLQIAEIATGTSIWLRTLASSSLLPSSTLYHGFDISPSQFPPSSSLPSTIHLHTHNATLPFPPEFLNQFSIVHIRLLVLGLTPADWIKIARNAASLLHPGGYIQWDEADFSGVQVTARDGELQVAHGPNIPAIPGTAMRAMARAMHNIFVGERAGNLSAWSKLPNVFREAGFVDVRHDQVMNDRVPGSRIDMAGVGLDALLGVLTQSLSMGSRPRAGFEEGEEEREWGEEDVLAMYERAKAEMQDGVYWPYSLNVFTGRKNGG